jgi:hypothetical protein
MLLMGPLEAGDGRGNLMTKGLQGLEYRPVIVKEDFDRA